MGVSHGRRALPDVRKPSPRSKSASSAGSNIKPLVAPGSDESSQLNSQARHNHGIPKLPGTPADPVVPSQPLGWMAAVSARDRKNAPSPRQVIVIGRQRTGALFDWLRVRRTLRLAGRSFQMRPLRLPLRRKRNGGPWPVSSFRAFTPRASSQSPSLRMPCPAGETEWLSSIRSARDEEQPESSEPEARGSEMKR
jgi:hypothetical protein